MDREVLTDRGGSGGADRRKAEWISTEDRKRESSVLRQGEKERERERDRETVAGERQADARALGVPSTNVGAGYYGIGRDGEVGGREHVRTGRIESGGEGDFRRALKHGVRGGQRQEGSNSWFVPAYPNHPSPLPLPPPRPPISRTFQHADERLWSSGYGLADDNENARFGCA
jgi:hypothetical protein